MAKDLPHELIPEFLKMKRKKYKYKYKKSTSSNDNPHTVNYVDASTSSFWN